MMATALGLRLPRSKTDACPEGLKHRAPGTRTEKDKAAEFVILQVSLEYGVVALI